MSESGAPQTTNGAHVRNWDALAALIAALIGVMALLVSGYTAYIQRQQVRAQGQIQRMTTAAWAV